jgi:hypothetical protein
MARLSTGSVGTALVSRELCWNAIAASASSLPLLCVAVWLATLAGCGSGPPKHVESSRLHVVAVLYGKYLSAHDGEMPANEQELAEFIDTNEQDILLRNGCKSAQELIASNREPQQLVVLYRDHRERLNTDWVAIEKQEVEHKDSKSQGAARKRFCWFAVNVGGLGKEIKDDEASHILVEQKPPEKGTAKERNSKT